MRRVAVVGGGIAGLALAHRLTELKRENRLACEVTLFEGGSRLGGTIETEARDGFVLEKGPDAFLSEKPWALELSKRIGLESQIIGTNAANRKSFIVKNGRLIPVPEGFYLITPTQLTPFLRSPLFSWGGKLRMGLEPFIPKRKGGADESIGAFIRRRFGNEALERAGQPMLAGVYTGDPERLSLEATMPRFKKYEEEYGSVLKGLLASLGQGRSSAKKASGPRYSLFLAYKNGMETLTKKLAERIGDSSIRLNAVVRSARRDRDTEKWRLEFTDGRSEIFDAVCLALPARQSADILREAFRPLSERLDTIPYESVATLNLAFRRADIPHKLDGFGFVVPKTEGRSVIACTFTDRKFEHRAPDGFALLRAFVGGAFGRAELEKSDAELEKDVLADLGELLGIHASPVFSALRRYPRAMVQYCVGHRELVNSLDEELKRAPGLHLTGSAYRGVGIPDCVLEAETTAEKIAKENHA